LHTLLSEQLEPSGLAGFEHCPLAESQVPTPWHASEAVHVTGLPATQPPP